MSVEEFSNEFDVLYNNISSNQAPGLTEYEKSVFLTKAQEEVLKNYFNPKGNKYQEGFDGNQKRQIDFSSIIRTLNLELLDESPRIDGRSLVYKFPTSLLAVINETFVDSEGVRYTVIPLSFEEYQRVLLKPYAYPPKRCMWRLISEPVTSVTSNWWLTSLKPHTLLKLESTNASGKPINVSLTFNSGTGDGEAPTIKDNGNGIDIIMSIPLGTNGSVSYWQRYLLDESVTKYVTLGFPNVSSDFLGDNKSLTYNFMVDAPGLTNKVELIGRTRNQNETFLNARSVYMCRYVKKPSPIVLVDLDVDDYTVSINGVVKQTECELPEELHPEILQRAVELAKVTYGGDLNQANAAIESGKRSE